MMKNKRSGFLLIGIGLFFLIFDFTKNYYWFKTHITFDLIPDPIGYLLIGTGLFVLGSAVKSFRTAGLFALAGFILSLLNLWNYSSAQTQIILKIFTAISLAGMFWFYLSGMQKTAAKADEVLLCGRARHMRTVYLLVCAINTFLSCSYISAAPLEPGATVSLLVIIFGILIAAVQTYILYLSFSSFRRLGDAVKQMWEEEF